MILYRRPISKTWRKKSSFSSNLRSCTRRLPLRKSFATIMPEMMLNVSLSSRTTRFACDWYDSTSTLSVYSLTFSDASRRLNSERSSSVSRSGMNAASRMSADSSSICGMSSSSLSSLSLFAPSVLAPVSSWSSVAVATRATLSAVAVAGAVAVVDCSTSLVVLAVLAALADAGAGGGDGATADWIDASVLAFTVEFWSSVFACLRREPARCCASKQRTQ